jgi:CRP-like cAMP-binding protein
LATTWWEEIDITSDDKGEQYIAALYWAFTTMTTVGYGDITPKNNYERLYAIMAMLLGAPIFGYIVGSIAALAGQNSSTFEAQGKKRVGTVLEFCAEQQVGRKYRERVHKHYQFLYQQRAPHLEPHLLASLSGPLRKEVTVFINRHAISKICLFVGAGPSDQPEQQQPRWFVAWAMRLLEPQTAAKGQEILNADEQAAVHEIFFVYEGYCEAYIHTPLCIDRSRNLNLESVEVSSADRQEDAPGPVARLSEGTQHRRERQGGAKSPETLGSGLEASDASANSDVAGAVSRTSSTGSIALMVFGPGCMFGLEHHLDKRLRYSVRCSKTMTCLLYVLRQSAIVELAQTVPEMASVLRSAATSALIRQMKVKSSDYDWLRRRPEFGRGSDVSVAEPPAAMKPVLPTAFSSPSSPIPMRP